VAAAFAHRRKTLEPHPCALPRAEGRYYRQQAGKFNNTCPFPRPLVGAIPTDLPGCPPAYWANGHVSIRGDGGSRTRVQKHLLICYYTLIPCICSCLATPKGKRRCFGQQRQISGLLLVAKIQPYPGLRLGCHPSGSGGGSKGYPKIRQPLLQVQHLFFFNLFNECPRLRPRRATHASASLSIPSIPKELEAAVHPKSAK